MAQCSFSPPPEAKWLIGTHHKTGTVLNEELLSHVWGLGPTVVKHCDEDAVKHLEQCVGEPGGASAQSLRPRICVKTATACECTGLNWSRVPKER